MDSRTFGEARREVMRARLGKGAGDTEEVNTGGTVEMEAMIGRNGSDEEGEESGEMM